MTYRCAFRIILTTGTISLAAAWLFSLWKSASLVISPESFSAGVGLNPGSIALEVGNRGFALPIFARLDPIPYYQEPLSPMGRWSSGLNHLSAGEWLYGLEFPIWSVWPPLVCVASLFCHIMEKLPARGKMDLLPFRKRRNSL